MSLSDRTHFFLFLASCFFRALHTGMTCLGGHQVVTSLAVASSSVPRYLLTSNLALTWESTRFIGRNCSNCIMHTTDNIPVQHPYSHTRPRIMSASCWPFAAVLHCAIPWRHRLHCGTYLAENSGR